MKIKTLLPIILLIMLFLEAAAAFHGKTELICEKCHTMHYSSDGSIPETGGEGPFGNLLVKERSSELCLTCHDGKAGTPDVIGGNDVNGLTERAAGFFEAIDAPNANGHDLQADGVGHSALCSVCHSGGNFSTAKIGCIDCHDPHGKDTDDSLYSYRNLHSATEPDEEKIFRAFVNPDAAGLEVYEQSNIGYAAPDKQASDWREVTNICFDCHHVFSADGYTRNADGLSIRHPATDSERGIWEPINKHGPPQTDPVHWGNGTGIGFAMERVPFVVSGATDYVGATNVATKDSRTNNEVFCLTCHKAHGSGYENSLRWPENSNLACQQCHNKG